MKLRIINIGNSKGIILGKTIIERYHFQNQAELIMKQDHLEIKPVKPPREGWEESFRKMHLNNDDAILIEDELGEGSGKDPGEDPGEDLDDDFEEGWE